jgi:hypothetical protein
MHPGHCATSRFARVQGQHDVGLFALPLTGDGGANHRTQKPGPPPSGLPVAIVGLSQGRTDDQSTWILQNKPLKSSYLKHKQLYFK